MCSRVRGPAIAPSLVTCPTRGSAYRSPWRPRSCAEPRYGPARRSRRPGRPGIAERLNRIDDDQRRASPRSSRSRVDVGSTSRRTLAPVQHSRRARRQAAQATLHRCSRAPATPRCRSCATSAARWWTSRYQGRHKQHDAAGNDPPSPGRGQLRRARGESTTARPSPPPLALWSRAAVVAAGLRPVSAHVLAELFHAAHAGQRPCHFGASARTQCRRSGGGDGALQSVAMGDESYEQMYAGSRASAFNVYSHAVADHRARRGLARDSSQPHADRVNGAPLTHMRGSGSPSRPSGRTAISHTAVTAHTAP